MDGWLNSAFLPQNPLQDDWFSLASLLASNWILNCSAWPPNNCCNMFQSSGSFMFSSLCCLHLCLANFPSITSYCKAILESCLLFCCALLNSIFCFSVLVRIGHTILFQIFLRFITLFDTNYTPLSSMGAFLVQTNFTFIAWDYL